jgi:hypothetical protein
MSLLAGFYLIERSLVDQLLENATVIVEKKWFSQKTIDRYYELLQTRSTSLQNMEYKDYNGAVFLNATEFLSQCRGIDLDRSELQPQAAEITRIRKTSTWFLTYAQRIQYADQLNPDGFSPDELQTFNTAFDGDDDRDWAIAVQEAIRIISINLTAIPDDQHVLLFDLG